MPTEAHQEKTQESIQEKSFDYDLPQSTLGGKTSTAQAWAKVPTALTPDKQKSIIEDIKKLLILTQTVLVAHYYVDGVIQDLAMATGGCVADSLEMARFGRDHPANRLIVAGVRFMGETAKILSPDKTILMPDLDATCSLDLGCPASELRAFKAQYPDHQLVVYANTSAEVKAMADWMVTSSCALSIVNHLKAKGQKIVWAPDRHLGRYIRDETGAEMVLWDGACIVHDEFKGEELMAMRKLHPKAMVLVHPESPKSVVEQADVVGSTSALLQAAIEGTAQEYIVATDQGLLHQMQKQAPYKIFLAAPTAGQSATCKSCAFCPWMAMNSLQDILHCLQHNTGEIQVSRDTGERAQVCINRMLNFTSKQKKATSADTPHLPDLGAV